MQPTLALAVYLAAATLLPAQAVSVTLTCAPGTADLGPGHTAETAWLYDGLLPGPVLRITEGQTLRVRFRNQLNEDSTVHWHGQSVSLGQDGMAGISRPSVAPGQEFRCELAGLEPGTYWYHPHSTHHHQLDRGLAGVLIVDPANTANEPASDVDQVVVLDDWLQPFGSGYQGHLLNGRTSAGQVPVAVQPGDRLRLRLVNVAAHTNYVVALDGHSMTVTHGDGRRLAPVVCDALPIGIGERYDVIVDCTNPGIWSLAAAAVQNRTATLVRGIVHYAGQTGPPPAASWVPGKLSGGALLDYAQLRSFLPSPVAPPAVTAPMVLSMGMGMTFRINGQAWPNVTPLPIAAGDVVQLDFATLMMMGGHGWHPMHLHGHAFRLMGTAGGTTHAPIKDTVLLRPTGLPWSSASVQFVADNPGRWLLHCHDMMHMAGGMMTLVDYTGDADLDGIPDRRDMEPEASTPVLTIPEQAAAFAPGSAGQVLVQWQPGQWCTLYASLFEQAPRSFPPFGELFLAAPVELGAGLVGTGGQAAFAYALPADPVLSGFTLHLQALAGATLPGGVRLSTFQPFHVR